MIIVFEKLRFLKMFSVHAKTQCRRFQISSGLKSVFEKLCFRVRLVLTVGLTIEKKAAFSNFSSVLWTEPEIGQHQEVQLRGAFD